MSSLQAGPDQAANSTIFVCTGLKFFIDAVNGMLGAGTFGNPGSCYHSGSIFDSLKTKYAVTSFNTEEKLFFLIYMSEIGSMVGVTGNTEFGY